MIVIDLSHTITQDMPVYPGLDQPQIEQATTIEDDGFAEKILRFYSHTGTHLDAPAHIRADGATLNEMAVNTYCGNAICLDVQEKTIDVSHLEPYRNKLNTVDFVLVKTGWSRYWGSEAYFHGYPVLTQEAAQYLQEFSLKGIGFDTISADREDDTSFPIHQIILKKMIIVENLTNLEQLPEAAFFFSCLPLKIQEADGSPTRAVALLDSHF